MTPLTSFNGFTRLMMRAAGSGFYQIMGTCGLIFLGLYILSKEFTIGIFSSKTSLSSDQIIKQSIAILLISTLCGLLIVGLLHVSSRRPETIWISHWMYGRYGDAIIAPIILIGALNLKNKMLAWAIPVLVISGLLLWLAVADEYTKVAYFNSSSFWPFFLLFEQGIWIWMLFGLSLIHI